MSLDDEWEKGNAWNENPDRIGYDGTLGTQLELCPMLYGGDCLDVIPTLEDKSIQLVMTSPPIF